MMDTDISSMSPSSYEADEELPAFAAQFNKNIRPLLDAVDKLRNLKVTNEGIPLPTIVVVGDQSSGKSSVLESLAGISLPRGQGIATRVPLVLRLQSCPPAESSVYISYKDNIVRIGEDQIREAVDQATKTLAGDGKGVSDTAISLHIRKPDAPDLTMIDLPGITRVPVHGQPANIYEKIAAMIRHYVTPPETVILNVLSATVDFSTCESIRISKEVDKLGERTLAVVTKVDKSPEGVYEKVMNNDVRIGLGYICVRNRTDDDGSHDAARHIEQQLFENHPSLSLLDKRSVGIPALAERLSMIQAKMIRSRLPAIEKEIDRALVERQKELDDLMEDLPGDGDPSEWFFQIMHDTMTTMQELIVHGNYDKFVDQKNMYYSARLEEICLKFSLKLSQTLQLLLTPDKTKEIQVRITEGRGLSLPDVISPTIFRTLVSEEIDNISDLCTGVVTDAHSYATQFARYILETSTSSFPHLQEIFKQIAKEVLAASRVTCMDFVYRLVAKERSSVSTVNGIYMENVVKIQSHLADCRARLNFNSPLQVAGVQNRINFSELQAYYADNIYLSAFVRKIHMVAYLSICHARMADEILLEVRYSLEDALLRSFNKRVLEAARSQPISHIMQELASNLQNKAKPTGGCLENLNEWFHVDDMANPRWV